MIQVTVLRLSVTKWVHLNWGDEGLICLFAKIWQILRPGGILLLEPQPWKFYERKHLMSEVAVENFHEIIFKPDAFRDILLDKIGFNFQVSGNDQYAMCMCQIAQLDLIGQLICFGNDLQDLEEIMSN